MINQNITEENRITFDNPLKYEYKYSPNIGNHKFSWFYVECESKLLIEFMEQLPPNMLIGEIDDLQQLMYAFGEGNFDLQY